MDAATQYALAYALTTTAGLRGFLALFAASVAAHYHWIHPSAGFGWLASDGVLAVFGIFAIAELIADKIPAVDHALHAVSLAARPLAGAVLVGGTVDTTNHAALYGLMAVGALNALVVHASSATTRAASTITTYGLANPLISVIEDAIAAVELVVSFLSPIVGAILAFALVATIVYVAFRFYARARHVRASSLSAKAARPN